MLEQQKFLISQSWRLGSETPAGLISPVALLLGSHMSALLLPLHTVIPLCMGSPTSVYPHLILKGPQSEGIKAILTASLYDS